MRCLIVEDDLTSRLLLQRMLAAYGACDVAVNGKEALSAFDMAHGEGEPYDLIFLDIMMPEMNGREVLEYIRDKEKSLGIRPYREVKVIVTTALDTPKDVFGIFMDGCTSYLVKPVVRNELLAEIRKLGLI
jgi:two-component system chemotaxis response regulator CheY